MQLVIKIILALAIIAGIYWVIQDNYSEDTIPTEVQNKEDSTSTDQESSLKPSTNTTTSLKHDFSTEDLSTHSIDSISNNSSDEINLEMQRAVENPVILEENLGGINSFPSEEERENAIHNAPETTDTEITGDIVPTGETETLIEGITPEADTSSPMNIIPTENLR